MKASTVVQSSVFTKRQRGRNRLPQLFALSINVYGTNSSADGISSQIAKLSIYLQHPRSLYAEVEYRNPQYLIFNNEDIDMRQLIGIGSDSPQISQMKISKEVENILESLTGVNFTGEKFEVPGTLTSKLKEQDGLRFILQREGKEFSQQLSAQLCQVIMARAEETSVSFGGIIADVMGLGKTLTTLAAILYSLPEAKLFSDFYKKPLEKKAHRVRTKATLVVVPSARHHICPKALSFTRFHGSSRPQSPEALRLTDLTLTTYATLAADQAGRRVLQQMEWYRVVLDEAHWIRNSDSKQFRAAASLCTMRRWCLTGTPIQNKLEDLTSLAQFLQLSPVSTRGGPNFAKPLRTYLEAYCLRRSERCLTLPPSKPEYVLIQLSPEEQRLYKTVLDETRRQIDSLVSDGDIMKCNQLFVAMIKLRMVCNLGTFSTTQTRAGSSGQPYLEVGCERCLKMNDNDLMHLSGCVVCPDCGRPLRLSSPLSSSIDNQRDAGNDYGDINAIAGKMTQILAASSNSVQQVGISTKLSAVVENVRRSGLETKSIIFSCWTSTLDVLYQMFKEANILCLQIDGRVGNVERSTRLKTFKEDSQARILLMSFGTGAVGLNLTVANRVHIVEPQWNPSVEEQAIARAVRMGQTRKVTIVRYMVDKTVEKNIVSLQQMKKQLAQFTFDTRKGETHSVALEDYKRVLDLGPK
ncbi:P-loop containing nucleoside triphosphate hydrolase protein [Annulohypoxylon stygium]|nr:P-loop containing nucleoside triphosphate hydrolase protein [Annulohypoxylon stygium]